ncbi:uncharacterized protein LOC123516580 [Portunus trituberculatus]|uniref:uncharacterized protein LOC123516580 n=1 Tax=Portunus trituberculatus TaxID=210409 RepID=UPI001E1D0B12|nr:uncharacterized protein LOC123516580 [Portunus trituberculatus]
MKLLWALACLFGVWVCHGLPQKEPVLSNKAEECVMYRSKSPARPIMQFQRRISVAIMPQEPIFTAELILQSTKTNRKCQFFLMAGFIMLACGEGNAVRENIESSDITELWMEVARETDDSASTAWDLKVMVRQGKHRTYILRHETGLQPPINMSVKSDQSIQYYFNCVTGCLFDKSVTMAPGDHTFFLRQDGDYVHMNIDGGWFKHPLGNPHVDKTVPVLPPSREGTDLNFSNLKPLIDSNAEDLPLSGSAADVSFGEKKLSINVTTDQLGLTRGLKEVTVVWDVNLGNIGALVDGVPLFNHTLYTNLTKERQLKVKMGKLSSGLVAPCNPNFQMVEFGGDEEVTKTKTILQSPPRHLRQRTFQQQMTSAKNLRLASRRPADGFQQFSPSWC